MYHLCIHTSLSNYIHVYSSIPLLIIVVIELVFDHTNTFGGGEERGEDDIIYLPFCHPALMPNTHCSHSELTSHCSPWPVWSVCVLVCVAGGTGISSRKWVHGWGFNNIIPQEFLFEPYLTF